jgi:hypothetical protein
LIKNETQQVPDKPAWSADSNWNFAGKCLVTSILPRALIRSATGRFDMNFLFERCSAAVVAPGSADSFISNDDPKLHVANFSQRPVTISDISKKC